MKKIIHILSIAVLVSGNATARTGQDALKANYLYTHLAYNEAIPYFEKLAASSSDPVLLSRLGDCYRLTKQEQQAASWYAKAATIPGCPPETWLHYGQALMTLQQYDKAKQWLDKYRAAFPNERRAANLVQSCSQATALLDRMPEGSSTLLSFNTDRSEFGPSLAHGKLLFATDSLRGGGGKKDEWTGMSYYNIYSVSRDAGGYCGSDLQQIATNVNSKFHDGPGVFTADGKQMYFTRTNHRQVLLRDQSFADPEGTVRLQIMVGTNYNEAEHKFEKIQPFVHNNRNYSTAHPGVSPSGNLLVFSSDMKGGEGGTDLYLCRREGNGWSKPENLGKMVNTEGAEMLPCLYDDNTLYFSSDSWIGLGGLDVYRVQLRDDGTVASEPVNVGQPVNSPYDDMSYAVASGQPNAYFASNRPAAKGKDNVYLYKEEKVFLKLRVLDSFSREPLSGCAIILQKGSTSNTLTTDANGTVFSRLFPQADYEVRFTKAGYAPQVMPVSTISRMKDTIEKEILLRPDFSIQYRALVLDEETKAPIPEPLVVFENVSSGHTDTVALGTGQSFSDMLQPNSDYHVFAMKENYYSVEKTISTKGLKPGGNTQIRDTIFMKKLRVHDVYEIENIYYDYDKANIRKDAEPALDQLLGLLERQPNMRIQINSHTDCRGSNAYNTRLSDARAASVVKYLKAKGIDIGRLQSMGFGESNPKVQCPDCKKCTEDEHQTNRRTEFEILAL